MIGTGVLCRSLYKLELSALPSVSTTLTVNTANSSKRLRLNEKSSTLWHKRLGHISRHKMNRLIKDENFQDLDFSDFDTCVDSSKGKLTTKVRCGPLFFDHVRPHSMGETRFFVVENHLKKKRFGVATYFCFYFKRENKIRRKNHKCDS